ncbi:hypothetical protein [Tenacibaculum finnmarkense]|uniref:hypothetical protein n=1 Tax=Tenacibaculum finnmarkense TaxID=2781243 RepID=UPI000C50F044|nr:hypothetical protein [Tenacibaculum finnmarkense]MCD8402054.1 hypothetical protein [Tenacibaculum finnmarkense genomovar finnmarkense]MCD8439321.1 hypothetical protein [Tenacibaculum finnmarkense genomovar ulcerans]MCG8720169.1 hypothetical protein [Tenacibaculum finnmarkense]SOS56292.1 conserved hypothetical protein [Tenacibaculum finnmarkense]
MKKNIIYTYSRFVDIELHVDIDFLDIRITSFKLNSSSDVKYRLDIIIQTQLEEFESLTDGIAYTRPKLLIAFGILSYTTGEVFTPFDTIQSNAIIGDFTIFCTNKFNYNGKCLLDKYLLFESKVKSHEDKNFIYSLLDRWRKGLFLEQESTDNMIYDDETLLSYFHILELLTTKYEKEQRKEVVEKINSFTANLLTDSFFLSHGNLENKTTEKSKLIEGLLATEFSVANKISYMFNKQGLLSSQIKYFIADFIKDRNSVAHGRTVYQDRVIFPVPPFFPLIKIKNYELEFYRILTAKSIDSYLEIDFYNDEWLELTNIIMPSYDTLKEFYKEKKFENLSNVDFCNGVENNITPYVVSHYLTSKKIKPKQALEILTNFIENYQETEEETIMSIWSIIIILDYIQDKSLKNKCIEIIKIAYSKKWHPSCFKMRDELYTLEYYGFETKEFKNLLQKKVIR